MNRQQIAHDTTINAFFKALELRDFEQTDIILQKLYDLASQKNNYRIWATYLSGVLEQEKNNDWAKAETIFNRVLASQPPKEVEALVYLSKSIAYQRLGRWQRCMDAASMSAQLWGALDQPLRKATTFRQIGVACVGGYLAGDFPDEKLKEGRDKCHEALHILQSSHITSPDTGLYEFDRELYQATTHEVLGAIENSDGNFEQASQHFHSYLKIAKSRRDTFHIGLASSHLGKTLHRSNMSQWRYILSLYDDAIDIFHDMQESLFEFHALAAKGTLYRQIGMPKNAIDCYERSLSLLETVRAGISSESARRDFFSKVVNIHDNAILAETAIGNPFSAFVNAELARSRTFVDALADLERGVAASNLLKVLNSNLLQRLPADCILLEFHCLGLLKRSGGQMNQQQATVDVLYPGAKTMAFVISEGAVHTCDLDFDPNNLIPGSLDKHVEEHLLNPQIRTYLYDKLIAPVSHLFKDKRRIYVIPHGPLHYVPFQALIAPDGDTLLRDAGPEIVYAPCATILFRDLDKKSKPLPNTCLAVGYNGDKGAELHFAEEEASYISRMTGGTAMVGAQSKKEYLYAHSPNYNAIHFSCHGDFDSESPLKSSLHIGPAETLTGQEIIDNLCLNCDLVTLSACESGLSRVRRGDELYGLIRAFMYAGASAVIATLWRVDERSTLIFAEKFYEQLQVSLSYASAMKEAQLYLKNLTRKEAIDVLTGHLASSHQLSDQVALTSTAEKYLKGMERIAEQTTYELIPDEHAGGNDDELVFTDPKYWAPFVLIGDPLIHHQSLLGADSQ